MLSGKVGHYPHRPTIFAEIRSNKPASRRSILVVKTNWRMLAACKGMDGKLFFGIGEDEEQKARLERESAAKAVCHGCSVRGACLREAIDNREQGLWGGLTKYERKRLLKKEKSTKKVPIQDLVKGRTARKPKVQPQIVVLQKRLGWDGVEVVISSADFGLAWHGVMWVIEKNGLVLYETEDQDDAWLMFASWTVTF